ncbi:cobalt-precorrin-6A reductase [Asaia sp. VD9]|uniref:cobalt-precorrin-6A reductase n=1 Tax=Asaia sp. VD9 TaxID=3081235 RepID=UPI0030196675
MKILILGGTTEARLLCEALESRGLHHIIFSLAGVTISALPVPVETRIGGFGGIAGLARTLRDAAIDLVIDATHPFAAQMSRHAVEACALCALPLLRLIRPAWRPGTGAHWTHAPAIAEVPKALGETPRRVFLTTGRKDLDPFIDTPHFYVVRSIERPPLPLPRRSLVILARGPFALDEEITLLRHHEIDCLVTKNAGSDATAPKLEAAKQLGIEVVMVDRPPLPPANECTSVEEALAWIQGMRRSV